MENRYISKHEAMSILLKWEDYNNEAILDRQTVEAMTIEELQAELNTRQTSSDYSIPKEDKLDLLIVLGSIQAFQFRLTAFKEAGRQLLEAWQELQTQEDGMVKNYPVYMPSFDEFVADFASVEYNEYRPKGGRA